MAAEKILIVDDEEGMRRLLDRLLSREGYETATVGSGKDAIRQMRADTFDLVVTDIKMPEMDGLQLLDEIKAYNPSLPVIVITAYGTVENAVQALRAGAYDYITKPFESDELRLTVAQVLERQRLLVENRYLHQELEGRYSFSGIVGASQGMSKIFETASAVAASNASVMITGESGTGKELIARSIHFSSGRKEKPFVVLNCAALSEGVLESELFGHERGAFSGAVALKKGRFELAHEGTLFIDEVGEMSLNAQVKLLRVIQEHEFERVGGTKTIRTDVRIVAATNKDLRTLINQGMFREDLFYRINVVPLRLPPLRERSEDVPDLVRHFFKQGESEGLQTKRISSGGIELMKRYPWPGNVRELENLIRRLAALYAQDEISAEIIESELKTGEQPSVPGGTLIP
ncbi:MAG: sigma-54 dependent transcriptional regulator, partial [Desulfuromonadales bacterium]|nr:sigma-54 dependent transcriptional regulator [Desulfuromonadales bacterium]